MVDRCLRSYPGWVFVGVTAALCGLTAVAPADVVTILPTKDNTLIESAVGANSNGSGPFIFCGRTAATPPNPPEGTKLRAALAFDICGNVPRGATIKSASLILTMVQTTSGNQETSLHRLLADWGEGTSSSQGGVGSASTAGDATWIHTFYPDQFWASAGGDYNAMASAEQTIGFSGPYEWSSKQTALDVQGWLDDPASNYGWLLIGNEGALMTAKKFGSREWEIPEEQPMLVIDYTPGCAADIAPAGGNGTVNVSDLLAVIGSWGPCDGCPADIAPSCPNGTVNVQDLLAVIASWGACP